MTDDELRHAEYQAQQVRRAIAQRILRRLPAGDPVARAALAARYQPIRDYQQEQRHHERQDIRQGGGVIVN